jgi:hypothetical protein
MAYDIPTRFHKVLSRHLREIEQTKMCGRIRIIVKKKRRIAICHLTKVRGDVKTTELHKILLNNVIL